ncbi:MAG: FAD-dependent thymidylate synthase [Candidatus Peribacteraceae bacterium]|nr:FAD-dependent thymidylate synthase [Candidatus Peribacteraceae bacterium]
MVETKKPEVILFGKPHDPFMALNHRHQSFDTKEIFKDWIVEGLSEATKYPLLPHPLDRFRLSFILFNVSRAFQQQLTRHRLDFSYSIQSLRMVNVGSFHDSGNYHLPDSILSDDEGQDIFNYTMRSTQFEYHNLIEYGVPVQDSRGVLPLNIHSTVTFSCTFRALRDMLGQRLCFSTQGEFREVARQIKQQTTEWNEFFGNLLTCPCDTTGQCFMNNETCKKVTSGKTKLKV